MNLRGLFEFITWPILNHKTCETEIDKSKKQFYKYKMAKKMYLSASSKKLQVHAKYVFHATVHVFTENYCSWLCMCDLEAEGKIDMFMLGQKIILLFLFLPLTILFL